MPRGQPAWRSSGDSTCTQLRCPSSGDRAGSGHPRVPSALPQPQDVWAAQLPEAAGRCCCLALPLHAGGTSSCSGVGRGNAPQEQHELPPGSIFDCCCHMEEDGSVKTELLNNLPACRDLCFMEVDTSEGTARWAVSPHHSR